MRRRGLVVPPIIGDSRVIRRLVTLARRVAPGRHALLLAGATGTGKEAFARNIHAWSGVRGALVDVNCAALPEGLIEGLLFGAKRGAYTGAVADQRGFVEAAQGGTLFLDELDSLPLEGQGKLLRVLETGEVERLGETESRSVRFRLIAAVKDDIGCAVEAGGFRRDLFMRIAGFVLSLPPLVKRPEDLMLLAAHFAAAEGRAVDPACEPVLRRYWWPGNVRELRMTLQRASVLTSGISIGPVIMAEAMAMIPQWAESHPAFPPDVEILHACSEYRWHAQRTARALGMGRTTLWRRLGALGLSLRQAKKGEPIVSRVARGRDS